MGNDSRQGRKQQRRSGWKWTAIAGVTALVVVLVFVLGMALGRGRHNRMDVASSSAAVTSSSRSTASSASSTTSSSSAVASAEESEDPYKFAVNDEDFAGTRFHGSAGEYDEKISIDSADSEDYNYVLTFTNTESSSEYKKVAVNITQGPTATFKVSQRPNAAPSPRTVKANTQINIIRALPTGNDDSDDGREYVGERYYLFYNNEGSVSIATPDFGGIVTDDGVTIDAEFVQE